MGLLFAVTFAPGASTAAAYPPDNAAVLYYQAFMLYQAEDEIKPMLDDYWHGQIKLNETLEAYLAKNRPVIDMVLDATRIDRCDWGLDYSQGTEVLLPPPTIRPGTSSSSSPPRLPCSSTRGTRGRPWNTASPCTAWRGISTSVR